MNNCIKIADNVSSTKPSIAEFLSGKNVFITGSTGFLGTVLIERLLSATPEIGKIFILIRGKNGKTAEERVQRMMNKMVFSKLTDMDKSKVVPVVGVLSEPNFGIETETYAMMINEVNIVYHVAATIRFSEFIGTAIKTNVIGTQIAVNFAKSLKHLSSFIYVSTAYCNSYHFREGIEEKVYPSDRDPYEMMKLVDDNNNFMHDLPQTGTEELKKFIGIHPNTYTFTKQLAENLIQREMKNLPVGIMRPSIVFGTHRDPHQGWIGSANNGHLGFMTAAAKGYLLTIRGDPNSVMDLIPCDYVVNATIALSWYVATHRIVTPEVIHCTGGEIKPLKIGHYCELLNQAIEKHPCDFFIRQPHVKVRNGLRHFLYTWIFLYLPAFATYFPEKFFPIDRKRDKRVIDYIRLFESGTKAFEYFMCKNFQYKMENSLRILSCLSKTDAEKYNYNVEYCDWAEYFEHQIKGVRYFHYRESKETGRRHRIMWHLQALLTLIWYVIGYFTISWCLTSVMPRNTSTLIASFILLFLRWL